MRGAFVRRHATKVVKEKGTERPTCLLGSMSDNRQAILIATKARKKNEVLPACGMDFDLFKCVSLPTTPGYARWSISSRNLGGVDEGFLFANGCTGDQIHVAQIGLFTVATGLGV